MVGEIGSWMDELTIILFYSKLCPSTAGSSPPIASNSPSIVFHSGDVAHFHCVLVTYWTISVTLVLCLMMVLRIMTSQ